MIVALYARVSTVRQAEKDLSIPDQLRQLREWCKGNSGDTIPIRNLLLEKLVFQVVSK